MSIDLNKFKNIFLEEAEEHIQKLNDNLLLLEKNPDEPKIFDELMRSAHTIKGSSATMQFQQVAFLTHVMEDIFDYARNGQLAITKKIIGLLFEALDGLQNAMSEIGKNKEEPNLSVLSAKLKKVTGVATEGIGRSLRTVDGKPVVQEKEKNKNENGAPVLLSGIEHAVEKLSHIKVPVERMDALMDLMEELLIDKMRLLQIEKGNKKTDEVVEHISRLISDLQFQVMQVRLVPVEQVFARFPRMVRDLSVAQGKKVDFEIVGGELELDRTIVDKLSEPILHMLRNAIDHGIEKDGYVKLSAAREKEFVLLSVENGGIDIDWKKLVTVSAKKGIVSDEKAGEYLTELSADESRTPRAEIVDMLFGGVSTNDAVTETSGRGVGMSIVRKFAVSVNGAVQVESPLAGGKGAKITLELPPTLAIINALLVEINHETMAIPFSSVDRAVAIQEQNIKLMGDREVAVESDADLPLVRFRKLEGTNNLVSKEVKKKQETVVIVKRGKDRAGIVVDKIVGGYEIIVKPMAPVLRHLNGFSGSTILGDGRTILIIDVLTMLKSTRILQN
jgi:two-component system chemotaxis sensor kinase CheA